MGAVVSHEPVARFTLATAQTWADPWPMYRALRDHDPVHHVVPGRSDGDYWVLSRHADVWNAARDHQTFSSAQGLTVTYGELELIGLQDNPPMVMQDPPVHTEFRKLVARGFTPRQVEAVEPAVRSFVVDRIATSPEGDATDLTRKIIQQGWMGLLVPEAQITILPLFYGSQLQTDREVGHGRCGYDHIVELECQ